MTDRPTVRFGVSEHEVDAESLERAVTEALDEDGVAQKTVGAFAHVAVIGDPDADDYVKIYHDDHGRVYFGRASDVLDMVEDARETPFEDVISNEYAGGSDLDGHALWELDDTFDGADLERRTAYHVMTHLQRFIEDENVEVVYARDNTDDDSLAIGIADAR